jgi:REP element-mobilizing transposase RayT
MGRPTRLQAANGFYHVTARGARQLPLYVDEIDYTRAIGILGTVVPRFRWECLGYCFMPNHLQLVIRTPEPNISAGMHRMNHDYAIRFNLRYGLKGHAFDRRFYSVLIEDEAPADGDAVRRAQSDRGKPSASLRPTGPTAASARRPAWCSRRRFWTCRSDAGCSAECPASAAPRSRTS